MEKIILNSKVIGMSHGKELSEAYRIVIEKIDNKWKFSPEQSFDGEFNEFSGLPGWELLSLKLNPVDELYIDHGQEWSVKGLIGAIAEAKEIAAEADKIERAQRIEAARQTA